MMGSMWNSSYQCIRSFIIVRLLQQLELDTFFGDWSLRGQAGPFWPRGYLESVTSGRSLLRMDCAERLAGCLSDISEMATGRVWSCNVRIFATGKGIPTINASDPRVNSASSAVGIDRQLDYRASFVIICKWREEGFPPHFKSPPVFLSMLHLSLRR